MKKNKKTYVLLIAVFSIWGLLGFKIVGALNTDAPKQELAMVSKKYSINSIKKRDTFSISANYRDPFLGTMPKAKTPKKIRKKSIKKPEFPKRNISYSGSVGQNGTKARMYFVTIDGQQHIMSNNEIISDVKLVSGNSESIKVRYNGRTETVVLSQ